MPVFLDRAKAHLESGLYFEPPHERCFRLDQAEFSGTLFKRFGVQEMDFGWWDASQRAMRLLEVKDYSVAAFNAEHYLNECLQKATDSLLLLASVWYGLPYGPQVRGCLPEEWHARPGAETRLHLFFVIKVSESTDAGPTKDPLGMDALEAKARNKMRGRLEMLQVLPATTVFLMNHRAAAGRGLPIKTEADFVGAPEPRRDARRSKRR